MAHDNDTKPRVLFIEDDAILLSSFSETFRESYTVFLAPSTVEAYELMKENSFDVVIADQIMPQETGVAFFERIRFEFPDACRLIMTGEDDIQVVIDAINKGQVYHYFRKPLISEEIRMVINNALKARELDQQLKSKEQQLKYTFEQVAVGFAWFGRDFRFLEVNRKFCELSGYEKHELLEMKVEEITDPADREDDKAQIKKLIAGTIPHVKQEKRLIRKDGTIIWGRMTLSIAYNDSGKLDRFIVVIEDISEKKKTLTSLQEIEQRFRDFSFSMRDMIWEVDMEGKYAFVAGNVEEMLGYTPEELIGRSPFDHMTENEVVRIIDRTSETILQRKPILDQMNWRVRKDGKEICVLINGVPILDKSGNWIGYRGVDKDITKLKLIEEELLEYRDHLENLVVQRTTELRKFSQVVEQSPISVVITDPEGMIEYVNPKFTEVTGYSFDDAVHQNTNILKGGRQSRESYGQLWDTITAGRVWRGEFANQKKNGDIFWESSTISPIKNDQDLITHFVAIKEDITAKKKTEKELKNQVAQLDRSRLSMLNMMEDLDAAKGEAEAATRAKSAFLANMSHEIRTPMNAILGFLGLALEDPDINEGQHRNLMTAYNSAKDLLALINDILDISKLESGKMELDKRQFLLPKLMHETLQTLNISAVAKGLFLELAIDPTVPQNVIGDSVRLKQILINLIGNSIKFTDKGSIRVALNPWTEKEMVHFTITDTGIGISHEQLGKIFDPFTQADGSTSRRFGGTGLGTTISRQLVELMDGKIWVESEPGQGSTFQFTVRLVETEQIQPVDDSSWSNLNIFSSEPLRCFRILMAEDIETNRTLGKIRLENQGHTLFLAHNGREALDIFRREEIDLILMDIQMPEMDGLEATSQIRKLEADTDRHIPIIALTASVMKEDVEKYQEVGMDAIVGKPIDFNYLFSIMEKIVPGSINRPKQSHREEHSTPNESVIPPLTGIDVEKGLKTWQEPKAYIRALLKFSQNYRNTATDITRLVEKGEMDEAYRLNHTLKGVAGNLSAIEVSRIAGKLNTALHKYRKKRVLELLPDLDVALKTAISSIGLLDFTKEIEETQKKELDLPKLEKTFQSMLTAFDLYNPDAVDPYLAELKEYLSMAQIESITRHIEGFNFDAAKYETSELARKLMIDLKA